MATVITNKSKLSVLKDIMLYRTHKTPEDAKWDRALDKVQGAGFFIAATYVLVTGFFEYPLWLG